MPAIWKMKSWPLLLLVSLLAIFLAGGCLVSKGKYNNTLADMESCQQLVEQLQGEKAAQEKDLRSIRARASDLEKDNRTLLDDMATLNAEQEELARKTSMYKKQLEERKQKIDRVTDTYRNLVERLSPEIDEGKIRIDRADTRLKLNLVDKILFPSGSATLTRKGKQILDKVGYALKETRDRKILIEGHTDDLPLSPELKKRFDSNWDLSAKRATAVVKHMQDKVGIDPRLLCATGYSMYSPIVKNDSAQNRQLNRRIEVVLVPLSPKEMQRLYAPAASTALPPTPTPTPEEAETPPAVIRILP
jgi:chemotaxis protein MotB